MSLCMPFAQLAHACCRVLPVMILDGVESAFCFRMAVVSNCVHMAGF